MTDQTNKTAINSGFGRVLIVAPTGRDATVITETLAHEGVIAVPLMFSALLAELGNESTGALIVAEEALLGGGASQLVQAMAGQPAWSDLPLIVLLAHRRPGGADPALAAELGVDGFALLLERPLRKTSLISAVNMALRSRLRQYEVRDHIRKYVRAAVELERADRGKDEFLAMLAHELRNPLGPIRNAGALLGSLGANNPKVTQLSDMIKRQSGHMTQLLDALLDVSRITRRKITLQRVTLNAAAIAQDAIDVARPMMQLRGHDFRIELPSYPVFMSGDATRLTQVLGNLLINAGKYTPPGGKIVLTLQETADEVIFRVTDSGVGIDAELLPRIFELFSQAETSLDRSEGGLGIGLAIVKGIVEMHQGLVTASSGGRDKGSEFTVRLPRLNDVEREIDVEAPGIQSAAPQRILIADDNADLAESMAMLLRFEGHEVRIANDGPSALILAEQFAPETAVLDIGLPGLNGYELGRKLRSRRNGEELLLIAVTGYGQLEDRERSQEAGFDCHLVKPLEPHVLGDEIAKRTADRKLINR